MDSIKYEQTIINLAGHKVSVIEKERLDIDLSGSVSYILLLEINDRKEKWSEPDWKYPLIQIKKCTS